MMFHESSPSLEIPDKNETDFFLAPTQVLGIRSHRSFFFVHVDEGTYVRRATRIAKKKKNWMTSPRNKDG